MSNFMRQKIPLYMHSLGSGHGVDCGDGGDGFVCSGGVSNLNKL